MFVVVEELGCEYPFVFSYIIVIPPNKDVDVIERLVLDYLFVNLFDQT